MKRDGIKKGIYILPNLFTTANLFCGFFSIIRAINGDFLTSAWMILFAGVFDFLDGRVARLTRTQSRFGLEYDSLVDLASFGLAPAVLMYTWTLFDFSRFGWSAAFLFFACGALRLARFNVQAANVEKKSFQGLPIPAAAYCLASYIILYNHLFGTGRAESYAMVLMTFVLALLMVSNVSYRSFKGLDFNRRASFFYLVLMVAVLFVIASEPAVMIFVFSAGYVVLGITEEIIHSPRKVRNFADFVAHYFHTPDGEEEAEAKRRTLKVIGIKEGADKDRHNLA
ncbi:MAG: CDP-diacylglycerol--serine O-phosphatidyltransferase [Deltaproteobacteria bacterium]|nr:CDP-diacylglycerol--serine O-phosphatidyltransferase [Deltaproteobacteria bacterium]